MSSAKTLKEWLAVFPKYKDEEIPDEEIERLIADSDPSNFKHFFNKHDTAEQKSLILAAYDFFVDQLNQPMHNLRKKTRLLIALNNFALYRPGRGPLFTAIKSLNAVFEDAMRQEGKMTFDAELGRMSEHVLVLVMRVSGYKLKAAQVLEFADHNAQFGVQLLLAILLKEPPYELELRCNCIAGLLGFTQPQAFFAATSELQEHSCEDFGLKIDFIGNLMLRLSAVQVVHDVLSPVLFDDTTLLVSPVVHRAVLHSMRCILNIFSFSTQGAQQWRQHILLNTSFVDGVVIPYLHKQIRSALSFNASGAAGSSTVLSSADIVKGLELSVRFMAFATFRLGRHARYIRIMSYFVHDLLQMPAEDFAMHHPALYTGLFHYMVNIDALAGDDGFMEASDELASELQSETLLSTLRQFLAQLPNGVLDAWHARFYSIDCDALVSQDCHTFVAIDTLFSELKRRSRTEPSKAIPSGTNSLLGDLPPVRRERRTEGLTDASTDMSVGINLVKPPIQIDDAITGAQQESTLPPSHLCCALNRHIMRNPMRSPYGHVYEEATITQWIKLNGHFCPITGNSLTLEQLKLDVPLQREIVQYHIQETLKLNNPEDDGDLYDF